MAAVRGAGRMTAQSGQSAGRPYRTTYIDGNVVRHIETVPAVKEQPKRELSSETRRNREKALHMTLAYVMFLTAAAAASVFLCVQYLQLQAMGTTYRKQIANLESTLNTARTANDNTYEEAMSSVNMERIKEIAVHDLGMTYADQGQVITYNSQDGDYIRQYAEIPPG